MDFTAATSLRILFGCLTLKSDEWPWKTIKHVFYAHQTFVHHFIAIFEFKLDMLSGNVKIWTIFFFTLMTLNFAWTLLLSIVITPENFMMIQWQKQYLKGVTDRHTDGQWHPLSCLVTVKRMIMNDKHCHIYRKAGNQKHFIFFEHTETWIKWPSFCWDHFQMHFVKRNILYFDSYFTEVCPQGLVYYKSSFVQVMPCHLFKAKSLPEPVMTLSTDAHYAPLDLNELMFHNQQNPIIWIWLWSVCIPPLCLCYVLYIVMQILLFQ